MATDLQAGSVGFDEEGGNSLPSRGRIGFGEDDVDASGEPLVTQVLVPLRR